MDQHAAAERISLRSLPRASLMIRPGSNSPLSIRYGQGRLPGPEPGPLRKLLDYMVPFEPLAVRQQGDRRAIVLDFRWPADRGTLI